MAERQDHLKQAVRDRPELVDCEWMSAALASAGVLGDARIEAMEFAPVGNGMMSDCFRFKLSYPDPKARGPRTVIGKFPAADPTSRSTGVSLLIYMSEVRFYQVLASRIRTRTPHVYLAEIDRQTGAFTLLMEDLTPARSIDQLAGCSTSDCEIAIRGLAGLHGPLWNDPAVGELDVLRSRKSRRPVLFERIKTAAAGFLDRYAGQLDPATRTTVEKYWPVYIKLLSDVEMASTLRHSDYRLDNLLFDVGGDSGQMAVLDWGGINFGSGLMDLATFIGQSLTAEERNASEERLVKYYYDQILAQGVRGYSWNQCWLDYRRSAFAGMSLSVSSSMWVERSERADRLFMDMARKTARQIDDLDAFAAWN
jgi:hypothetical protein